MWQSKARCRILLFSHSTAGVINKKYNNLYPISTDRTPVPCPEPNNSLITKMLLFLRLDRFPVSCTEPNDLILNRFLAGKCFVVKFAVLYLSFVGSVRQSHM